LLAALPDVVFDGLAVYVQGPEYVDVDLGALLVEDEWDEDDDVLDMGVDTVPLNADDPDQVVLLSGGADSDVLGSVRVARGSVEVVCVGCGAANGIAGSMEVFDEEEGSGKGCDELSGGGDGSSCRS